MKNLSKIVKTNSLFLWITVYRILYSIIECFSTGHVICEKSQYNFSLQYSKVLNKFVWKNVNEENSF